MLSLCSAWKSSSAIGTSGAARPLGPSPTRARGSPCPTAEGGEQRHDGVRDEERRHVVVEVLRDLVERGPQLDGGFATGVRAADRGRRPGSRARRAWPPPRPRGPTRRAAPRASRRRPRSALRVLLHRAGDDGRDLGRDVLAERCRFVVDDGVQHRGDRRPRERPPPRQELVEHRAEREDVGAHRDPAAGHLLGGHVVRRAADGPARAGVHGAAGEPEVEDLDLPVRQDAHVAGLEVAVDEAASVGERHAVEDLVHDGPCGPRASRPPSSR